MTFDLLFIVALAALIVGPRKAAEMGKDFARWKAKLAALSGDLRSTLQEEFKNLEAGTPSLQAPPSQPISQMESVAPAREDGFAKNADNVGIGSAQSANGG